LTDADSLGERARALKKGQVGLLRVGGSIGMWAGVSYDPRRFLPPYAEQFVQELVAYSRRAYPRPKLARRAPPLPRPKEPPPERL
jgi:LysR family transcriptional regulator, cyn operon transcriptional activator